MKLTNSVDVFAKWWLSMDTALSTVEHSAASLQSRPGNALTLKVNRIRKRWEAIHDDYQSYKIQVCPCGSALGISVPTLTPFEDYSAAGHLSITTYKGRAGRTHGHGRLSCAAKRRVYLLIDRIL
jgi:hypothetical protein